MIKIYYCNIPNFGDAMNPLLLEELLGQKCCFGNKYRADIIGIGSILTSLCRPRIDAKIKNLFAKPSTVWSSGFIKEVEYKESFRKNIKFSALRGKISQTRVEKIIGKKLDIALGDGGLLFSKLLKKQPAKQYQVGIVPHTVDYDNRWIKKISEDIPHSVIIDVRQAPLDTLNQIASCEFIVSTAMHGLIAADSLGIPNKWIEVSKGVVGDGYKFRDYYSVFEKYSQTAYCVNEQNEVTMQRINQWQDEYSLKLNEVDKISLNLYKALTQIEI